MSKQILSKRKTDAIANGIFLISLGALFYTNFWWPGILLAIWASLAARQYLSGRLYDLFISSAILLGLFVVSLVKLDWAVLMPILFVIGGLYIIFREYFFAESKEGNSDHKDKDNDRHR